MGEQTGLDGGQDRGAAGAGGQPGWARADVQDIRLAVVLNGGVSLAVWISGVVAEMNRLVQGSRAPAGARTGDVYAELLDLLGARARIDVIAGTSAGGLNGGFLALGLVRGADLSTMRDLWRDQGDLSRLLRDPRQKCASSLLRGDYFAEQLQQAYRRVVGSCTQRPAADDEHVDLYLTGTLWDGRTSSFADDMGRSIVELDHDATFLFSSDPRTVGGQAAGNLCQDDVASQLAVASRCTSSFPGAFEPFRVEVETVSAGDRWPSNAGLANFSTSQFVVDGGVLRNKPVRPALDAVYRQSADRQVRRVMAYVVPDPSERSAPTPAASGATAPPPPAAHDVLLGVLTRLRSSDSVAGELEEIEQRNADARLRRRTRDRLAQTFLDAASRGGAGLDGDRYDAAPDPERPPSDHATARSGMALAAAAFPAYRDVRNAVSSGTVARLLLAAPAPHRWSEEELATVLTELAGSEPGLPFVPAGDLDSARRAAPAQWRWGQSAVRRLGDLTVDVLKRAVWLAPMGSAARVEIVRCREQAHEVLERIRVDRASLDQFWRTQGLALPGRSPGRAATEADVAVLRDWLRSALDGWERTGGARRQQLYEQALGLASSIWAGRSALADVLASPSTLVDPRGQEHARLRALVDVLLDGSRSERDVLARMLDLEVVQVAFAGASGDVEQEVELVQISTNRPDLLTGIQAHHFGAFYRASWRVNDWLRGRLDGAEQLVTLLLAPERLRQVLDRYLPAQTDAQQGRRADDLLAALRAVAVGPAGSRYHQELAEEWDAQEAALRTELDVLFTAHRLPRTFPLIAARIARRLRASVLEDELVALASAVRGERDPLEESTAWAAQVVEATARPPVSLGVLERLEADSRELGRQLITDETARSTDTFARTSTHAAASLASMLSAVPRPTVLRTTLTALRGYAVLVWVLVNGLTTTSHTARNLVGVVVGVGAALVALTLVMPGVPIGVTLAGAGLLLAASTATAVAQRGQLGRGLAARTATACGVVVLVLAGAVAYDLRREGDQVLDALVSGAARVAVVVAVVALGWFVARARPAPERRRTPSAPAARQPSPPRTGTPRAAAPATGPADLVIDVTDRVTQRRPDDVPAPRRPLTRRLPPGRLGG